MPTDEERREIAAKLRELATQGRPTWTALVDLLKCPGRAVAVQYLADLMEPEERTCRDVSRGHEEFRCSECGTPVEVECDGFVLLIGGKADNVRFCPNCVAKVVSE